MVIVLPHVLFHTNEEIEGRAQNRQKREPLTTLAITTLVGLGVTGTALGATSLAVSHKGLQDLRVTIDKDIGRLESSM